MINLKVQVKDWFFERTVTMARVNTTQILTRLRQLMSSTAHAGGPLDAYIIPSGDAHQVSFYALPVTY